MKKILAILLCAFTIISLSACSGDKKVVSEQESMSDENISLSETKTENVAENIAVSQEYVTAIVNDKTIVFKNIVGEKEYIVKEEPTNLSDNQNIDVITVCGKEYNIQNIKISDLEKEGFVKDEDEKAFDFLDYKFLGKRYVRNKDAQTELLNQIYLELDDKEDIAALGIVGSENDVTFYKGIFVGMNENELLPLINGASKSTQALVDFYILKNSSTTLLIKVQDGLVENIFVVLNSLIENSN